MTQPGDCAVVLVHRGAVSETVLTLLFPDCGGLIAGLVSAVC